MIGREDKVSNDLFYICSLIEYISRKTHNRCSNVIAQIGKEEIKKIYKLADVYHCESLENIGNEFIEKFNITSGNYDNIKKCKYSIPTYFDIGKVYKRLIIGVSKEKEIDIIDALFDVFNSFIIDKIENYNSSFYYDAPQNILNTYLYGEIE